MNKKQKALIIIWCIGTAIVGLVTAQTDLSTANNPGFNDDYRHASAVKAALILWGTATLVGGGLFLLCSSKNKKPGPSD